MQVPGFEDLDRIEAAYLEQPSMPTLGQSYELMLTRWLQGQRGRELALRLLFLYWYSRSEPTGFTGLGNVSYSQILLAQIASELDVDRSSDLEVCFVLDIMANVWPEAFGADEAFWTATGERARAVLGAKNQSVDPEIFTGRGAYGEYFKHQATIALEHELRAGVNTH